MIWPGEKEAWDILTSLDPREVEKRAGALFNPHDSVYTLRCFNEDILISLTDREIIASSDLAGFLVNALKEYSRLSIVSYLVHAKDMPLTERLIKPTDLPGGDFFSRGFHVLPMDKITDRFENSVQEFINTGKALGGIQTEYGDASIRLFPFPRIPVVIILWAGDDEFPSKASLLFDSSCLSHMAVDILWATAMMTIEMMLIKNQNWNK